MGSKLKKLTVMLILLFALLNLISIIIDPVFSDNTGGKIDLFTQKEPYSGKGSYMISDAFSPGEEVKIFALVTYNYFPMEQLLVAFEVIGPENPIENITFSQTIFTNETGIATMHFRISHLNETTFGEWKVFGNTNIGDVTFQDIVSFKVGWIVNIVSIQTINGNYEPQEKFTRENHVGVELALRSIAMTEQKITLALVVYDCAATPINSTEINEFEVQPDGVLVYAHCFLYIPQSAHTGEATVRASVNTAPICQGGIPICPESSKEFFITNRDIAILSVQPFPTIVYIGETVNIDVFVENSGLEIESFNISVYYNETIIAVSSISNLESSLSVTVNFIWNTSKVEEGLYEISAYAKPVLGELDVENNRFVDDVVCVKRGAFPVAWEVPQWLLALLLLALSIGTSMIFAIVFASSRKREKKRNDQMKRRPLHPTIKFKRSKTCNICGRKFAGAYTFCPYCFTFHGKDYE